MQQSHQTPLNQNNRYSLYQAEDEEIIDLDDTSDIDEHPLQL